MSNQRVCDVGGEIIYEAGNEFYTVTGGISGARKDICYECARSLHPDWYKPWTASTEKSLANRVRPTVASGQSNNGRAYDVITAGVTGETEPTWTTGFTDTITDGTVVYSVTLVPNDNVAIRNGMPGNADELWSLWGWMTGAHETTDIA